MKIKGVSTKSKTHGLTLIEMLVVLVVVIILLVLFLPSAPHERRYAAVICINNLKEVDLGLTMYADDNNGKFPFQISVTNDGTMELIYSNHVFPHYEKASHALVDPRILVCPFDTTRHAATNFETLNDSNISYFLNADAKRDSSTNTILAGDRFLQNNGQSLKSGLFFLTTNLNMSWTADTHNGGGNLALSDGSVVQTKNGGVLSLSSFIKEQPLATNRLLIP